MPSRRFINRALVALSQTTPAWFVILTWACGFSCPPEYASFSHVLTLSVAKALHAPQPRPILSPCLTNTCRSFQGVTFFAVTILIDYHYKWKYRAKSVVS